MLMLMLKIGMKLEILEEEAKNQKASIIGNNRV